MNFPCSPADRPDAKRFDGLVLALHAKTGQQLWTLGLPGPIQGPPITYSVDGTQYVVISMRVTILRTATRCPYPRTLG